MRHSGILIAPCMVNLLWPTTSLMTCFVIKISLYGVESDAKRLTKKGKSGQNVMKCVIDFPPSI